MRALADALGYLCSGASAGLVGGPSPPPTGHLPDVNPKPSDPAARPPIDERTGETVTFVVGGATMSSESEPDNSQCGGAVTPLHRQ